MIGVDVQPRTPLITSVPSMSGRPRSRISTSGRSRAMAASPDVPSAAVLTSYCRAVRLIVSARKIAASSSTTSTFVMRVPSGGHAGAGNGGRQRDAHGQAATGGIGRHYGAAHRVEEPLDHRQAQADAGDAGAVGASAVESQEWLKHPRLQLVRHAAAMIDDLEQYAIASLTGPHARP